MQRPYGDQLQVKCSDRVWECVTRSWIVYSCMEGLVNSVVHPWPHHPISNDFHYCEMCRNTYGFTYYQYCNTITLKVERFIAMIVPFQFSIWLFLDSDLTIEFNYHFLVFSSPGGVDHWPWHVSGFDISFQKNIKTEFDRRAQITFWSGTMANIKSRMASVISCKNSVGYVKPWCVDP